MNRRPERSFVRNFIQKVTDLLLPHTLLEEIIRHARSCGRSAA